MNIELSKSTGKGPTKLSAFDSALNNAGVANFNLIRLSSVIPPKSQVKILDKAKSSGIWGDKLYVVMAEMRVSNHNEEAWAGIGWVQDQKTGKGLFVEHEGKSENSVREDIEDSLKALMKTRNVNYGEINMELSGIRCKRLPVCAMVVAVFESRSWNS